MTDSKTSPTKLTAVGIGSINNFKQRVLSVLADCWRGVYCVACEEGFIRFYDVAGKLMSECAVSNESEYDCGSITPDADYVGPTKIFFNDVESCVYYRQKDGSWYSPDSKI